MNISEEFLHEVENARAAVVSYTKMIRDEARRTAHDVAQFPTEADMLLEVRGIRPLNDEMDWVAEAGQLYQAGLFVEFYEVVKNNLPLKRVLH